MKLRTNDCPVLQSAIHLAEVMLGIVKMTNHFCGYISSSTLQSVTPGNGHMSKLHLLDTFFNIAAVILNFNQIPCDFDARITSPKIFDLPFLVLKY